MKDQSILIVGSIALDTIETTRGSKRNLIGGSTTYATIAAGSSAPVHVVGVVGTDFPAEGFQIYQRYATDLTDLKIEEGATFRWGGRYHEDMDSRDTLFTELGVFAKFSPHLSELNRKVPLVFLANIHPTLQLAVIDQCEGREKVVVDTMNLWINTTRKELAQVFRQSDILLLNEDESEMLSGSLILDESARYLQQLGPQTIVIKRGSQGAVLYHHNEKITVSVYAVREVVDPTGAGDTFGGGFMSALAKGGTVIDALVTGSALASICVEGFGIEALLNVTPDETQRRQAYLYSTVRAC